MHDLIQRDSRLHSDEVNISSSHVYFEELLLKHSVERSPKRYAVCTFLFCHYFYLNNALQIFAARKFSSEAMYL